MIHPRFFLAELRHGGAQALTFICCVALSIATLVALNSFRADVQRSLLSDAQVLHGGDVIIHGHHPPGDRLLQAVAELVEQGAAQSARTYEFNSVIRSEAGNTSLLVSVLAVDRRYPLYGAVELISGGDFDEVLQDGRVIVAPDVLQRLAVSVGDSLRIGDLTVTIADVLAHDPSRPVTIFALGPRIFATETDLATMGLLGTGSRSHYEVLIKLTDPRQAAAIAEQLQQTVDTGQERIETAATARSQVKRFFDNLLFFLSFISIFTLLLSGIGMQSSLSALLRQKHYTIAVSKTIGATSRFLFVHYLAVTLLLGLIGSLAGVGAGLLVKRAFPFLFGDLVPPGTVLGVGMVDIGEGMLIGLLVVVLFSSLPLYRIGTIRPVALLRHEANGRVGRPVSYLLASLVLLFLGLLVIRQLDDVKTGLLFMVASLSFIAVVFLLSTGLLKLLARLKIPSLALRQAQRSLFRPGNATRSIVVTLTSALAVLLTIFLLEFNLVNSFITSYPKDAPNLFCLDIQYDQRETFFSLIGEEVELFPVVRGRLLAINGEPIDYERENQRRSDSLAREFNLTYRTTLLDDERITRGGRLFDQSRVPAGVAEVSVLDTIAEIGDIRIGDRLEFTVQGLPLSAEVTSIRTRTKSKLYPFFYFVFTEEDLADAPHTLFAALHLERERIAETITRIVAALPNVSTINVAETAVRLGDLIGRLAGIITFFALFSMAAGAFILIGSVLATRLERIRDSSYYKIVGANNWFVLRITIYENLLLGGLSSILATGLGIGVSWLLCRIYFDIVFQLHLPAALVTILATCAAVVAVGLLSSLSIVRQKPITFLHRQSS